MPYLSAEEVKIRREAIKKAFPTWKFSIKRNSGSSGINVHILEADIQLLRNVEHTDESVNCFYIADNYKDMPEVRDALLRIKDIMNEGNETMYHDGDYGNIPKFYISLSIGAWDIPFKFLLTTKKTNTKTIVEPIKVEGKNEVIDYSEKAIAIVEIQNRLKIL